MIGEQHVLTAAHNVNHVIEYASGTPGAAIPRRIQSAIGAVISPGQKAIDELPFNQLIVEGAQFFKVPDALTRDLRVRNNAVSWNPSADFGVITVESVGCTTP
jgi:hypothetical protein